MQPARFASVVAAAILASPATFAQYSRGAWTSFGGDAQRTGWNKIETEITPQTARTFDGMLYCFSQGSPLPRH
jgi:hypothetical protein